MRVETLPDSLLSRKAIVYVRQSTQTEVQTNLESQRRQYDLVEVARRYGFRSVEVIDDDLGRSASGSVARPGLSGSSPRCAPEQHSEQRRMVELELQQARYAACRATLRRLRSGQPAHCCAARKELGSRFAASAGLRVESGGTRSTGLGPAHSRLHGACAGFGRGLEPSGRDHAVPPTAGPHPRYGYYDADSHEIVLVIHWRGGQHSELRVRKPKPGEHECRTSEQAVAVIRSMAARWSDESIAATLNRMGLPTGQRKSWTAHRVGSLRRVRGIHAFKSADKNGEWLAIRDAAAKLASHIIRSAGSSRRVFLPPSRWFQMLHIKSARAICRMNESLRPWRKGRPCRVIPKNQTSMTSDT